MHFLKNKKTTNINIFISLSAALVLASLPVEIFKDRENYILWVETALPKLVQYFLEGALPVLFNEPIWHLILAFLNFATTPESAIRAVIFISTAATLSRVLPKDPKYTAIVILFLLSPQILKNHITHLRQGLATSFFLIGFFSNKSFFKYLFIVASPLVHILFLPILLLFIFSDAINRIRYTVNLKLLAVIFLCGIMAASFMTISLALDARQADRYLSNEASITGLGFIYWLFAVMVFLSQGNSFIKNNLFQISSIIFYLISYFIIGGPSARIFESALILILLSSLQLSSIRRILFIISYLFYSTLMYVTRIDQPILGFGA